MRGRLEHDGAGLVICELCGRAYHGLGVHSWRAHGVSAAQYRAIYALNRGTPLLSVDAAEHFRARVNMSAPPPIVHRGHRRVGQRDRDEGRRHKNGRPWPDDAKWAADVLRGLGL
jgi:hypothetical protein